MAFTYDYPRPAVTADIILFYRNSKHEEILLIKRKHAPFEGTWALPGGFMDMHETLEETARRELLEETGIIADKLTQFKTYDKPGRDPRGRTISTVYYTILNKKPKNAAAGDDAAELQWFELANLPELAFDHEEIIEDAIKMILKQT